VGGGFDTFAGGRKRSIRKVIEDNPLTTLQVCAAGEPGREQVQEQLNATFWSV